MNTHSHKAFAMSSEPENITPLAGSSEPTGQAPAFTPTTAPVPSYRMYAWPNRMEETTEQRLVALNQEYDRVIAFHDAACDAEDAALHGSPEAENASTRVGHASRMMKEVEVAAYAIPARTVREVALKARIASYAKALFWDDRDLAEDADLRFLIEDVLALGGIGRIYQRDFTFGDLMPGYAGPERTDPADYARPSTSTSDAAPAAAGSVEALGRETMKLWDLYSRLDQHEDKSELPFKVDARKGRLIERIYALEAQASYVPAQSASEAMFHILLVRDAIDTLASSASAEFKTNPTVDRALRCLYSIMGVLEKISGKTAESVGAEIYMRANINPWHSDPAIAGLDVLFNAPTAEVDQKRDAA